MRHAGDERATATTIAGAAASLRTSQLTVVLILCLCLCLGLGLGAVAPGASAASPLAGMAEREPDLSTFLRAVEGVGLAETLTASAYTVFAPTDAAFDRAEVDLQTLLKPENAGRLLRLLRAHIVADDIDMEMAIGLGQARTIDGGNVDLYTEGDRLMVGDATVLRSGIRQGGLRIYAIDRLLAPAVR